ncbi:uracil-DNA glycosylase [Nitrospira sp. M1]
MDKVSCRYGSVFGSYGTIVAMSSLKVLHQTVSDCTLCPRLTKYRREISRVKVKRFQDWDYWGRPIPGFGDQKARLFVVGLAPAAHGGNRTGRVFTGDRSGDWLYDALHQFGFANQPDSTHAKDGMKLKDCYIAAAVRCAPPANKPLKEEFDACRPYLKEEFRLLKGVKVVVALGKIAFDEYLKTCQELGFAVPSPKPKFGHGVSYVLPWHVTLLGSYHPSQQNTFTGKLTRPMFYEVFQQARSVLKNKT